MTRLKFFILIAILMSYATPSKAAYCNPAAGATCLTDPPSACETLGTTVLDGDKKNLIACLVGDAGSNVWKSMTMSVKKKNCSWKSAPNAWVSGNQEKYASCDDNQYVAAVMFRMISEHVDDEHVDVYCCDLQ